jgi:DNA/RNA-binding domain of Phe-tRNA-synthetase-like protein
MLVTGAENPVQSGALESRLTEIEEELRARYAGFDRAALRASEPIAAYDRYYRGFGQTYHVQHQIESVVLKGKAIPRRAALVESAFAEELNSGLLTAMHDVDAIGETITADVATGAESVELYNGKMVQLDENDMYMRDERGILTSVVRGPAAYGLVTSDTTSVAVCVYAPEGVRADAVHTHLERVAANMQLVAPSARIELLEVIFA